MGEAVRQELDKILQSSSLVRSKRLCRFLKFTVEAVLDGREQEIKERSIGTEVFERGEGFDPSADNIVRIEAARLRHKLREYYASEGESDPIRIEIPKGSYVPVFEFRDGHPPALRKRYSVAVAGMTAVIVCAVLLVRAGYLPQKPLDPRAVTLCRKGRYLWNQRTFDSLKKSVEAYKQAIARAPNYADAWTGLADSYAVLVGNDYPDSKSYVRDGVAAANRAIRLNPRAGRPHAALAAFYVETRDWTSAERENRLAVQLSPDDATAHQWYGHLLMFRHRYDEALAELRKAEQLDPLQPMIGVNIGDVYNAMHEYDKALEQYRKTLDLQSDCVAAALGIEGVMIVRHQYREALNDVERWLAMFPDDPGLKAARRMCLEGLARPARSS